MSDKYLPHIDMNDGVARVMNNKGLYLTLLSRFKLRPMTEALLAAIASGEHAQVTQAAHALRGTAANLGLPTLGALTGDIEQLGKKAESASAFVQPLSDLLETLEPLIAQAIADK